MVRDNIVDMISRDSIQEPSYYKIAYNHFGEPPLSDLEYVGIHDAIRESSNIDTAIKYIATNFVQLLPQLLLVVRDHYPEKALDVAKLAMLI